MDFVSKEFLLPVRRLIAACVSITFSLSILSPSSAQTFKNPSLQFSADSAVFVPVLLKGLTIHPEDPLQFDFIVDSGNTDFSSGDVRQESQRLIKYFMTALTVPKDDLWVNLSPEEPDRIIPSALGKTDLGRDMLAQDYVLKQITSSLMNPGSEPGKRFWDMIYRQAQEKFGTTEIPVDTFNKVWIIPESASVYENGPTVYIIGSRLKVMLEEDYLAQQQSVGAGSKPALTQGRVTNPPLQDDIKSIIRDIILPAIEREVNEGEHFAPLRQIYHSLILAKWYKDILKGSILSNIYFDQNKISGIESDDPTAKDRIYNQYVETFQKGTFNVIKEDYDPSNQQVIPRQYFSGGEELGIIPLNRVQDMSGLEAFAVGPNYTLTMRMESLKGQGNKAMLNFPKASGDSKEKNPYITDDNSGVDEAALAKHLRSLPIYSLARLFNLREDEKSLLLDSDNPHGSIDIFLPKKEDINKELLENIYKEVSEKDGKLEEIVGEQSEAASFSMFLRRSTDSLSGSSSIRLEINDDFYIEVIPKRREVATKDERYHHREDIKFISALNALTYVSEEVRSGMPNEGEENYETYDKRKKVFAEFLGQENAKYFDVIRAVRIETANAADGNDIIKIIGKGNANEFLKFEEKFEGQLNKYFPNESYEEALRKLRQAVNRYIDLNDLLIEIVNKNVRDGLWGYDEALKILFLQQIKVGIVSEGVVDGINKTNAEIYVAWEDGAEYKFNLQYNPERANRGSWATKDMNEGETNLSIRFCEQWLPLQRNIPFKGNFAYQIRANPFPHLRNSINMVGNDPTAKQVASYDNLLDVYSFLEKADPGEGEERFRAFLNSRFGGASFDSIHFQGFLKRTAFEDAIEGIEGDAFEIITKDEHVTISKIKKDVYWMPTVLAVQGNDKESVVRGLVTILKQANSDGSLELTADSKFSYNVLFKYEGHSYYAYIFVTKFKASDPANPDPDKRIVEVGTEVSAERDESDKYFMGRPAMIEMVDTLIYDKKQVRQMYEDVLDDRTKQERVFSVLAEKLKYDDFPALVEELQSDKAMMGDPGQKNMSILALTLLLEKNGVTDPQVDEYFVTIFNAVRKINPDVDPRALFELYKHESVQRHIKDFKYPSGVVVTRLLSDNIHSRYGGDTYDRIVKKDFFLDFLREEMGISDVYRRETAYVINDGSSDPYALNQDHYYTQNYYDSYIASEKFDALLKFCVFAKDLPIRKVLLGETDDYRSMVESGVRLLGKDRGKGVIGNKESGFLLLDRLGLSYPPGIVLSEELVKTILSMSDKEQKAVMPYLLENLARSGIDVGKEELAVRSNPKQSMPGILTTETDVASNVNHLQNAIKFVGDSWYSGQAFRYRKTANLGDAYDLPIIIQLLRGEKQEYDSQFKNWFKDHSYAEKRKADPALPLYASGVFSTRNPNTNEEILFGRYIENAKGEKLMTGGENGEDINKLAKVAPDVYRQLLDANKKLEAEVGPQEVEFTVNDGKLYFLQTRELHFSPQAEIAYIHELLAAHKITEALAIPLIEALQERLKNRKIYKIKDGANLEAIASASASTPGVFQGYLVFNGEQARQLMSEGKPIIFVILNSYAAKWLLPLMFEYPNSGLITRYGNGSSHETVLTRLAGITSLVNLNIDWFASEDDVLYESYDFLVGDLDVPAFRKSLREWSNGWYLKHNITVRQILGTTPEKIDQVTEQNKIDQVTEQNFVKALNAILKMPDFHARIDDRYKSRLSPEIQKLLASAEMPDAMLSELEYMKLNKALLLAVYPDEILNRLLYFENGLTLHQGDEVLIDGNKSILYRAPKENVLEENGVVLDASYGIDIPAMRKTFLAPYLNNDETIKSEVTLQQLEELNKIAVEKFTMLEAGEDKKAAFIANLEKHFLHDLLIQFQQSNPALGVEQGKDDAMLSAPGGIDMNDVQIQRLGSGGSVQFDPAALQSLKEQDVSGFVPVITGFTPIKSLSVVLDLPSSR